MIGLGTVASTLFAQCLVSLWLVWNERKSQATQNQSSARGFVPLHCKIACCCTAKNKAWKNTFIFCYTVYTIYLVSRIPDIGCHVYFYTLLNHVAVKESFSAASISSRTAAVERILLYGRISNTQLHKNGWQSHLPPDRMVWRCREAPQVENGKKIVLEK